MVWSHFKAFFPPDKIEPPDLKVKEENEKAGLKLSFQNTKVMASGPITSWQIYGETMERVRVISIRGQYKKIFGP